ncbi:Sporulation stage II protein D, amidase enhancer LytB [Candidatus Omnitrophus magneticus]|uniref:Sporulation stage II protein D, amidase enhancer LytB n=1 Tax=Candidatus Omnitrophus magneticus TaxID=1609969 RepID=A0A0F0CL60_9BACT|nr:Sporulation stage II protein D, amidase enhancer LytB [Candidatus Omnitrophus magneticus]
MFKAARYLFILAKNKIVWLSLLIILLAAVYWVYFSLSYFYEINFLEKENYKKFFIRVRVDSGKKEVSVSADNLLRVRDGLTGSLLKIVESPGKTIVFSQEDSGIKVDDTIFQATILYLSLKPEGTIYIGKTAYRGDFKIIKGEDGLNIINMVEIEDYLKGVVPCEVSALWPMSALKAQAIVSRSYAVSQALRRKNKEYDLAADTYSQVYKGKDAEQWRALRAVRETRGDILTFNNRVLPAYFHSCCGGHTQDITRVWGEEKISPLSGVECQWCRWMPHFRWQTRVQEDKMIIGLNEKGYDILSIQNISIGDRDDSGRVSFFNLNTDKGLIKIDGMDFANIVGRRFIKSLNTQVKSYPGYYYFSGYGWGHGVGMCQWGAFGLSLRWSNTEDILKIYYPGAGIDKLWGVIGGEQREQETKKKEASLEKKKKYRRFFIFPLPYVMK